MGLWIGHLCTWCLWLSSRVPRVALWMLCRGFWPRVLCRRMTGSKGRGCRALPDVLMGVARVAASCSRAKLLKHQPV
uniref:Putative secreted protein n=1 Tax=Ixodes ricinus TaxID=34613 RepID=A0A6B0U4N1_IXORI